MSQFESQCPPIFQLLNGSGVIRYAELYRLEYQREVSLK